MTDKKRVLVLLATYNGQKYIEEQLESILVQIDVDVELLVSDDNSTDNTLEIVNKLAKDCDINLLTNRKTLGSSANFFNLIENCNTQFIDYIAFSDQDDIWNKDKIISAINLLESSNCDGFSSDVIAYWPELNRKKLLKKSYTQQEYDHWFESPGPGCSQVFTVKSFESFKKFIMKNRRKLTKIEYHDWLIYSYYKHNNYKWIISDEPKMLYRQHQSNVSGANYTIKAKLTRFNKILDDWYKNQIMLNYEVITNKEFNEFVRSERLLFKPLSLRRNKLYSLFIWLLLCLGILKN